jgi:cellulose synthase/poly-beta-1,6-N-acetylglucosamine synthase-like glycosyltransferase
VAALVTLAVVWSFSYALALFVVSRRRHRPPLLAPPDLSFVFLVPCLDEELVVETSLQRLLALPGPVAHVVVIDDGSTDRTGEIVQRIAADNPRVHLLQRRPPEARQGKGRALNAGYRFIKESEILSGTDHSTVIVGVVDADGRLEPNALFEVAPLFTDKSVAAVQIGVRMYNASTSLLARMQDIEFVTFTEIFQRARQRLGSSGLGGNGQFVRLSALETLGDQPWSDCLTEDLDLGISLLTKGWKNRFCPTTWVNQQAVTSLRRLLRQRSRWFQGHLQCWRRIPDILRSSLTFRAMGDLLFNLLSPGLTLLMTIPVVLFFAIGLLLLLSNSSVVSWQAPRIARIVSFYLLTFCYAPFVTFVYWLHDRSTTAPKSLVLSHLYQIYSYLWFVAGWWAVGRITLRRRSWAKTARTRDLPETDVGDRPAA